MYTLSLRAHCRLVGGLGEGVMSKWYKLLGGEQQKRLWVLKTTSAAAGGPKPKYLRKLIAALWENELTLGGFFQLLRYRYSRSLTCSAAGFSLAALHVESVYPLLN